MIVYALTGFILGLAFAVVVISSGFGLIIIKQRKGLHSKKTNKGIFIYACSRKL